MRCRVSRLRIPAAAVSLIALLVSLPNLRSQQDATLRVDVRLVHLLATVRTETGALVTDLSKDDFTVFDDAVPQKIALFERTSNQPLSVSILIDNSGSTAKDLKSEVDSVNRFVRDLFASGNQNDCVALYSFNWEVVKHNGFTRGAGAIERELRALRGEGGTSLYDAIYLSSDELLGREGRHVMVIVTDGEDTTSRKDYQAALRAAQTADVVIYPILVVPIENEAGRSIGGENALTTLAKSTGGRVSLPTVGGELDRAFNQIITELRTQYFIAYYRDLGSPTMRDSFHRISLLVARPGLRVSTRAGYYEESAVPSGTSRNVQSR